MNSQLYQKLLYGFVVCLIALTGVFFDLVDHFDVISEELIANEELQHPLDAWSILPRDSLSEAGPVLFSEVRSVAQIFGVPVSRLVQVKVQVSVQTTKEVVSSEPLARADIYGRTAKEKFRWLGNVGFVVAGIGAQTLTNVMPIPNDANELRIEVERVSNDGLFQLHQVSVRGVQEKPYRLIVQPLLLTCWIFVAIAGAILLWRIGRKLLIVSSVAVLSLLLLIPESLKIRLQGVFDLGFESADHILLFFLLGIVIFYRQKTGFLVAVMFVLIAELLQNFTAHREVLFSDFLANLIGLSIAYLICEFVRFGNRAFIRR